MPNNEATAATDLERQAALEPSLAKSQALAFDADRARTEPKDEGSSKRLKLHLFRN